MFKHLRGPLTRLRALISPPGAMSSIKALLLGHSTCWLQVFNYTNPISNWGFPGGARGKELLCQCRRLRDTVVIPGLGRSPGGGHGNPLHYACLQNPMDRGACGLQSTGVAKSWMQLKWLSTHACIGHWGVKKGASWKCENNKWGLMFLNLLRVRSWVKCLTDISFTFLCANPNLKSTFH